VAVVWEHVAGGDHYQVRTAGRSVRLYKNNVFHSQWNETRPLSGGVWDLLFIPALFLPSESVRRILLLGVGGGAVIRQYLSFMPVEQIIGVELDPVHIQVAKEYFNVNQANVELIEADAVKWVESYRGQKFDLVIEDLFTEEKGEPVRVADASEQWFSSLRGLLRPQGMLIINFEDAQQLRASGDAYMSAIGTAVDCRFGFTLPTYGNCVGAFLPTEVQPAKLRKRLNELLAKYPQSQRSAQKFRIRRIAAG